MKVYYLSRQLEIRLAEKYLPRKLIGQRMMSKQEAVLTALLGPKIFDHWGLSLLIF